MFSFFNDISKREIFDSKYFKYQFNFSFHVHFLLFQSSVSFFLLAQSSRFSTVQCILLVSQIRWCGSSTWMHAFCHEKARERVGYGNDAGEWIPRMDARGRKSQREPGEMKSLAMHAFLPCFLGRAIHRRLDKEKTGRGGREEQISSSWPNVDEGRSQTFSLSRARSVWSWPLLRPKQTYLEDNNHHHPGESTERRRWREEGWQR